MTEQPYTAPAITETAFHCPFCRAYAQQRWGKPLSQALIKPVTPFLASNGAITIGGAVGNLTDYFFSWCTHCGRTAFWDGVQLIYPDQLEGPSANPDLPDDIKADFEEARSIVSRSPRGAAALLRLCVQKLCKHLGEPGKDIDRDIASLVKKGLPEPVQQSLDIVRVVGNNAVHPGKIDLKDNKDLAMKLFDLVNIIADDRITRPEQVKAMYQRVLPKPAQDAIAKRDKQAP